MGLWQLELTGVRDGAAGARATNLRVVAGNTRWVVLRRRGMAGKAIRSREPNPQFVGVVA